MRNAILILASLWSFSAFAANTEPSPEAMAKTAAALLNESKTMSGLLAKLEPHFTTEEIAALRAFFLKKAKKDKVTLETAIPKARTAGAVLLIDLADFRVEFKKDNVIVYNGESFTLSGPLDVEVKKFFGDHSASHVVPTLFFGESARAEAFIAFGAMSTAGLSAVVGAVVAGDGVLKTTVSKPKAASPSNGDGGDASAGKR